LKKLESDLLNVNNTLIQSIKILNGEIVAHKVRKYIDKYKTILLILNNFIYTDQIGRPIGSLSEYNSSCNHIEQQLAGVATKDYSCE